MKALEVTSSSRPDPEVQHHAVAHPFRCVTEWSGQNFRSVRGRRKRKRKRRSEWPMRRSTGMTLWWWKQWTFNPMSKVGLGLHVGIQSSEPPRESSYNCSHGATESIPQRALPMSALSVLPEDFSSTTLPQLNLIQQILNCIRVWVGLWRYERNQIVPALESSQCGENR